jgi:hypothetical protein
MKKLWPFIKKWFFPPLFAWVFYSNFIFLWFFVDEWNRTLPNFKAFTVLMIVMYSPIYLVDDNDRFPGFNAFLNGLGKKWVRNIMIISLILLWIALMALADKYFPMQW